MISRKQFREMNGARWRSGFEAKGKLDGKEGLTAEEAREMPARFRRICQDLGLARERLYGLSMVSELNGLVMGLFQHLHRSRARFAPVKYLTRTFPGAFRHNIGLFLFSAGLFWVPFAVMALSGQWGLTWIQAVIGPEGMMSMDAMYGKEGDALEHGRETYGSDFMIFAFYVQNNVGIGLRMFGSGILFGLGTIFFSVYNGLYIGAAAGYVQVVGDPVKFWTFVSGHSAFELLGINVASMAGMRLGWGLVRATQLTRLSALIRNGREALVLLGGAATLIFLAAFIEGFWSAHPNPPLLKYGVGIGFWVLTLGYLFSGRKEWYERP
ncbi:MAG: stage II sporulation protein M [Verrucomicrobiota bacterium]